MKPSYLLLALFSSAISFGPLWPADDPLPEPLAESVLPMLERALAAPDPRTEIDALWNETIFAHGSPEPLVAACEARLRERIEEVLLASEEEDPSLDTPEILALRRLTARVARVFGDLTRARDLILKIPVEDETVADTLEKAQILDALGKNEEAHEAFGRVLDREIDEEVRSAVLLRRALLLDKKKTVASGGSGDSGGAIAALTLIAPAQPAGVATAATTTTAATTASPAGRVTGTSGGASSAGGGGAVAGDSTAPGDGAEEQSPLAKFASAEGRDKTLRNRAAMILALRGEQKDAIGVFSVEDGKGSHRYRQEVRLAEWSIEAEEWARAQEFAWGAVRSAKMKRDRRYALTILVEAYRRDSALDALIGKIRREENLSDETRQVWIDLLRETGRVEEAIELFRGRAGDQFTIDMRRELLEMCRETGQEEILVEEYRDLINTEPRFIEWREGLSRYYLERGNREQALDVWRPYLSVTDELRYRMAAAATLAAIGLDELAIEFARACEAMGEEARNGALLFLFELHHERSQMDDARAMLVELDEASDAIDPVRKDISDAYARLGDKERAVEILAGLRAAKGKDSNPDTDMKLALLLSDIGKEDEALDLWHEIWRAVDSIPRRRYIEGRMMAVASRLGKLATIAVRLERKLTDGTADDRDAGLLVRLYTHVKDPVSATEIVEEFWKESGKKPVEVLAEKARIFVACEDFYNYEKVVAELIEIDPDGRGDYLRQLAMSKLEGGKRDEAREILKRLKVEEADTASLEFEAGVLSIAGLREEALAAYRRSLALYPERIDTFLLLSNLQKELGRHNRSAGMFQYLAETAEKDDLFTIAIDGLLNMRDGRSNTGAPDRLIEWGRRIVLERISRRPDKLYLYRLLADLSEELNDTEGSIRALKNALPIAGEQRTPILRELMALAKPGGQRNSNMFVSGRNAPPQDDVDNTEQLMFGRRLLGQGELVPPQVYLELGEGFLRSREVVNATKTFQRMSQLPEYAEMQTQIAEAFEKSQYPKEALRIYERILTVEPSDVALLTKVGELHEQLGRDEVAYELYRRGFDIVLSRRPERKTVKKDDDAPPEPRDWYANRNVDEVEEYYSRLVAGLIATQADASVEGLLDRQLEAVDADLATVVGDGPTPDLTLEELPRLGGRLRAYRELANAFRKPTRIETLDRRVLAAFPDDDTLLESMVRARISSGYVVAARSLLEQSDRPEKEKRKLSLLVGGGRADDLPGVVPVAEATALILPLLAEGRHDAVKELLNRLELSTAEKTDQQRMPILVSTALFLGDSELVLSLCRHWLNLMIQHNPNALYGGVENILRQSSMILDETQRRSLIEQLVDAINESPDKFSSFVSQLPELQKSMGSELFTGEQVEKLIEKRLEANDQFIWGIPEMFALLPSAERGPIARRIWPKLPKAQAGMFAIQLVPSLDGEVDVSFASFLTEAFRKGVDQADDQRMFTYYSDQLVESPGDNAELCLRFIRVLRAKDSHDLGYRSGEAVLLHKLGRVEEAWEIAADLYRERLRALSGDRDYRVERAIGRVVETFFDDRSEQFFGLIDEVKSESGPDVELEKLRLELVGRADDPEALLVATVKAAEEFPEDAEILQRLHRLYSVRGEQFLAIELQKRLVAANENDESAQKRARDRLVSMWRGLRNPVEALGLLEKKEEQKEENAAAKKDRTLPASIVQVKREFEAGDTAQAFTTFRRLWRSFPGVGRNPYGGMVYISTPQGVVRYGGGYAGGRMVWPKDPPTEEEKEAAREKAKEKRWRGGLPDYSEEETDVADATDTEEEKDKERTAQEVFIETPLGEREVRRQLRSLPAYQLGSEVAADIFRALAKKEADRLGAEQALQALLEREQRGEVGKLEYGLLFSLLELVPELAPESLERTLSGLLENLSPTDTTQLRRLARLYAKSGFSQKAGTIYRWCAVVQPDRSFSYWSSASDLLGEVIEELDGDERIRTVEAVLALSDPGEEAFWGREYYETLVLETWEKLLGSDRALEKARAICESATNIENMPKRDTARVAAYLYARAGEIDNALDCLEVTLCKLDAPKDLKYSWYRSRFENAGWINVESQKKLFPEDAAIWQDAVAWYDALATRISEWNEADRLRENVAFELLALCALRLHEVGEAEGAARWVAVVEGLVGTSASHALWLADLHRKFGAEESAATIERRLLEEGRLNLGRLPEVVARIREVEGPELALTLGEPAGAYVLESVFLDELILAAEGAEKPDRAAHWTQIRAAAEAAKEELEKRDREAEGAK